jgi:hypothetical protein
MTKIPKNLDLGFVGVVRKKRKTWEVAVYLKCCKMQNAKVNKMIGSESEWVRECHQLDTTTDHVPSQPTSLSCVQLEIESLIGFVFEK